jgi:hypothetical protein
MTAHPFAAAADSGDPAAIAALFAEDMTFHTPILTEDLHGKELTLKFVARAANIIKDLKIHRPGERRPEIHPVLEGLTGEREIQVLRIIRYEHWRHSRWIVGHRTGPGRNCPVMLTMTWRCSW